MAKRHRVMFTFDENSLDGLKEVTSEGRFSSMAEAVRESLSICRALQSQAKQGFTEIVMRDPDTDDERVIVIPSLQRHEKS